MVEVLERQGGDLDAENEDGTTPRDLLDTRRQADVRADVLTEAA